MGPLCVLKCGRSTCGVMHKERKGSKKGRNWGENGVLEEENETSGAGVDGEVRGVRQMDGA